ncbi:pyrroloquinoline quinone biosynthesis protein PqqE [Beijerinckia indica]|uniref:PqqA peptide cyclase n=1 Tax=Beijerinckia indica subsp. indica (strain ATCC 9039 / DSM 1715 / NCIMB 8712) TaxID=395963 RepID=B2IDU6_BEII9|nr:pyrroloquinoline quinone biosynthesis protein PqqE [Beijerinckia indica]ACB96878.1 coenzyme PQQ biosynthesis protein E [Beijerinckia indica subsp. indica ATCC 9039]
MNETSPQNVAPPLTPPVAPPLGLLAELTHRCPLACPYCSNPLELEPLAHELDTATWNRVFSEAAALGVLQVHLSGGEPVARRDLTEIVTHCAKIGLYTNLITSGIGLTERGVEALSEAGLDHVQLSIQDAEAASADRIAGYEGAYAKKQAVAAWVIKAGLPLTVNAVIHHANVSRAGKMVEMAVKLGARRVEIAHTQYYGWGLVNRAALMPGRTEAEAAVAEVEALRQTYAGTIVIDHVMPDYHARYPKACMGGWARRTLNITPTGKALPCHAAETIPGLNFANVRDMSLADIWFHSPAFEAFRGTAWMREPCASCERKEIDFGGCRCQALALTGDASRTDPVCIASPDHDKVAAVAGFRQEGAAEVPYVYRRQKQPVSSV